MAEERTLILVKPDGVMNQHIGDIISRIERKGYKIEALKVVYATKEQLEKHYSDKVNESYFPDLVAYMQESSIVGIVATGYDVVATLHSMAGSTNPGKAAWGTVRGDYGREWGGKTLRNVIHTSDSVANAEREISIWF